MQKLLALSTVVCLGLAGCQLVEKSRTWETVMNVRPGECIREADPSSSYAEKLHRVLLDQGVEHIVVTYQYHYRTNHYEEALGSRTAVVYRDDANARYPWWLKDDRLDTPFWLPNGDLDKQISFYARRPVQVLEKKVYPAGGGSGKAALTHFHPAQVKSRERVAEHPQPVTKIVQTKPAPAVLPKPLITTNHQVAVKAATPAPAPSPVALTRIQRPPPVAISKPKPVSEPAPVSAPAPTPVVTTHSDTVWTPPATLAPAPVEQGPGVSPREEHWEKLFHTRNGTSYDPESAMDRRKMQQLKHGLVDSDVSEEPGLRGAVDGPEPR